MLLTRDAAEAAQHPARLRPALGFTLFYLGFIVLIPLSAAFLLTFQMTWQAFWEAVSSPRVLASYRLSFGASLAAALLNAFFGLIVAWILVRYEFPAGGSWMRWWTCRSRCRRRSPGSR